MNIDLSGKTAVVTGATGELGRVMVRTLAECGAEVAIHFLKNEAAARGLREELQAKGHRSLCVQADICDQDSVLRMRDRLRKDLGPAQIVVTNAVIQIHPWKGVLEEKAENYQSQFDSCVLQNVYMAKAFAPDMIQAKAGRIVGINTECAMQTHANSSAYTSGKRGMDGLLRCLAQELGPHGITVNQVAPGWTISDQDRAKGTELNAEYEAAVPLRRRGTDQEIANVVAFLASDLASYITGAFVPVCGGNVMPAI